MKRATTFNFLYMQQGVYNQRIFVSLAHRSPLNTYTDSFFHYCIFLFIYFIYLLFIYFIVLVFLDRIDYIVYTVRQEAHKNQAH